MLVVGAMALHKPYTVEESWSKKAIVRVIDGQGKVVTNGNVIQKVLNGRYEHVWVK